MSNAEPGSSNFINSSPAPKTAVVPGDRSGLVPSALNASADSAGSDAFVAPPGAPPNPTGGIGTTREAEDLARYNSRKPEKPSVTNLDAA